MSTLNVQRSASHDSSSTEEEIPDTPARSHSHYAPIKCSKKKVKCYATGTDQSLSSLSRAPLTEPDSRTVDWCSSNNHQISSCADMSYAINNSLPSISKSVGCLSPHKSLNSKSLHVTESVNNSSDKITLKDRDLSEGVSKSDACSTDFMPPRQNSSDCLKAKCLSSKLTKTDKTMKESDLTNPFYFNDSDTEDYESAQPTYQAKTSAYLSVDNHSECESGKTTKRDAKTSQIRLLRSLDSDTEDDEFAPPTSKSKIQNAGCLGLRNHSTRGKTKISKKRAEKSHRRQSFHSSDTEDGPIIPSTSESTKQNVGYLGLKNSPMHGKTKMSTKAAKNFQSQSFYSTDTEDDGIAPPTVESKMKNEGSVGSMNPSMRGKTNKAKKNSKNFVGHTFQSTDTEDSESNLPICEPQIQKTCRLNLMYPANHGKTKIKRMQTTTRQNHSVSSSDSEDGEIHQTTRKRKIRESRSKNSEYSIIDEILNDIDTVPESNLAEAVVHSINQKESVNCDKKNGCVTKDLRKTKHIVGEHQPGTKNLFNKQSTSTRSADTCLPDDAKGASESPLINDMINNVDDRLVPASKKKHSFKRLESHSKHGRSVETSTNDMFEVDRASTSSCVQAAKFYKLHNEGEVLSAHNSRKSSHKSSNKGKGKTLVKGASVRQNSDDRATSKHEHNKTSFKKGKHCTIPSEGQTSDHSSVETINQRTNVNNRVSYIEIDSDGCSSDNDIGAASCSRGNKRKGKTPKSDPFARSAELNAWKRSSINYDEDAVIITEITGIDDRDKIDAAIRQVRDSLGYYTVNDVIDRLLSDDCTAAVRWQNGQPSNKDDSDVDQLMSRAVQYSGTCVIDPAYAYMMSNRINQFTDYKWQVHMAIHEGTDVPQPPADYCGPSADSLVEEEVLQYLVNCRDAGLALPSRTGSGISGRHSHAGHRASTSRPPDNSGLSTSNSTHLPGTSRAPTGTERGQGRTAVTHRLPRDSARVAIASISAAATARSVRPHVGRSHRPFDSPLDPLFQPLLAAGTRRAPRRRTGGERTRQRRRVPQTDAMEEMFNQRAVRYLEDQVSQLRDIHRQLEVIAGHLNDDDSDESDSEYGLSNLLGGLRSRISLLSSPHSRHHLRFNDDSDDEDMDYEQLLSMIDGVGDAMPHGLEPQVISMLPTQSFSVSKLKQGETRGLECTICICEYVEGDQLRSLQCMHKFHVICIDQWLSVNRSCPICRVEVRV